MGSENSGVSLGKYVDGQDIYAGDVVTFNGFTTYRIESKHPESGLVWVDKAGGRYLAIICGGASLKLVRRAAPAKPENPFKRGDVVVCTKSSTCGAYKEGKLYAVREVRGNSLGTDTDEFGRRCNSFYAEKFRHATVDDLWQEITGFRQQLANGAERISKSENLERQLGEALQAKVRAEKETISAVKRLMEYADDCERQHNTIVRQIEDIRDLRFDLGMARETIERMRGAQDATARADIAVLKEKLELARLERDEARDALASRPNLPAVVVTYAPVRFEGWQDNRFGLFSCPDGLEVEAVRSGEVMHVGVKA